MGDTMTSTFEVLEEVTSNCFLCGCQFVEEDKDDGGGDHAAAGVKLQRFLVALQRFVNYPQSFKVTAAPEQLRCCEACVLLVEGFLEEYHAWKCGEMLLHWWIQQFITLLRGNGRQGGFPLDISRICEYARSNSFPRVRLSRIREDGIAEIFEEGAAKKESDSCLKPDVWLLSLAVVTLLGKQQSTAERKLNSPIQNCVEVATTAADKVDISADQRSHNLTAASSPVPQMMEEEAGNENYEDPPSSGGDQDSGMMSDTSEILEISPVPVVTEVQLKPMTDSCTDNTSNQILAVPCSRHPYHCQVCGYSSTSKSNLHIHFQSDKHKSNVQQLQKGGTPIIAEAELKSCLTEPKLGPVSQRFNCTNCSKSFGFRGLLQRHMREAHPQGYRCFICSNSYSTYFLYRQHIIKTHQPEWRNRLSNNRNNENVAPGRIANVDLPQTPVLQLLVVQASPPPAPCHAPPLPPPPQEIGNGDMPCDLRGARKRTYTEVDDDMKVDGGYSDDSASSHEDEEGHASSETETSSDEDFKEAKHPKIEKPASAPQINHRATKTGLMVTCSICQRNMPRNWEAIHFRFTHQVDDLNPSQIVRCDVPGCQAYFRNAGQKEEHKTREHNIPNEENESDDDYHKKKGILCPVCTCDRRFTTQEQLQNHEKLHGSFKCNFCPTEVFYAPDLPIHETEHVKETDNPEDSPFPCSRCKSRFRKKHYFTRHFSSEHLGLMEGACRCPLCDAPLKECPYREERNLQGHLQSIHGVENADDPPPENAVHCDLCPVFFRVPLQLHTHKMRHHWKGRCPECPYKPGVKPNNTVNWRQLKTHLKNKHPHLLSHLKFVCGATGCGKLYANQEMLDKHIKVVHPVESFQCSKCEKTFPNGQRLTMHENVAHGDHKFVCEECGKAFKVKAALQMHLEYHKRPEEWKFQCDVCQKRFADTQKLTQHQRTHTKEKPFVCQFCGATYAHRHNWRAHMIGKHPQDFQEMEGIGGNKKKEGNYMRRKGSKKGDCLVAGVSQQETAKE